MIHPQKSGYRAVAIFTLVLVAVVLCAPVATGAPITLYNTADNTATGAICTLCSIIPIGNDVVAGYAIGSSDLNINNTSAWLFALYFPDQGTGMANSTRLLTGASLPTLNQVVLSLGAVFPGTSTGGTYTAGEISYVVHIVSGGNGGGGGGNDPGGQVPEPASVGLVGAGIGAILYCRFRR